MKQKFHGRGDLAINPEAVGLTWARTPREDSIRGGVAVIQIRGPLEHHGSGGWWSWFESYESILGRVEGAMQCEDVSSILLDIDSPGGEVSGLQETVRSIRKMRAEYDKPIVAFADDEAYSAAYALACSADEIYMPEGGGVGSVGVIAEVQNLIGAADKAGVKIAVIRSGNRKADGHPFLPLDDATKARVQKRVDALAVQFFSLVREARPISKADLVALQGATVFGKAAVKAGLADGILSFDEVLAGMSDGSDRHDENPDFGAKGLNSALLDTHDGSGITSNHGHNAGAPGMNFKALEKKVATAMAAVLAAKTSAEKKKATAAYAAAVSALTEAKVKKTYEKKTTETETEEDDGNKDPEPDDDDPDDDDDDEEEKSKASDEDEEKAEKMKKSKKASALAPGLTLEAFALALTGQSDPVAAAQVLSAMHAQAELGAANAAEIEKLKASAAKSKLDGMIKEGMAAGKIKPAQLAWAKTQTAGSLKAYLDATPASFAPRMPSTEESPIASTIDGPTDKDGMTDFERKLCVESGITVESYKAQRARGIQAPKEVH